MRHRLPAASAILALLLVGAVVLVRSERVGHAIAWRLEKWVVTHTDLQLRCGHLQLEVLPPGLVLRNAQLSRDGLHLEVRWARVRPRLWPTLQGTPVLSEVALDGVRLSLFLGATPTTPPPPGSGRPATSMGLPVDIRRLRLTDLELDLRSPTQQLSLSRATAAFAPTAGGSQVQLDLPTGSLRLGAGGALLPLRLHGSLRLQGSSDRLQGLEAIDLAGSLASIHAEAQGRVGLAGPIPELWLTTHLTGPLVALRQLLPQMPTCTGDVDLEMDWRGSAHQPTVNVRGEAEEVTWAGHLWGNVQLEAVYGDGLVLFETLRLHLPGGGSLTGSGQLQPTGSRPLSLSLRLHDVPASALLAPLRVHLPVHALVAGDVHLLGPLRPLDLAIEPLLGLRQLALLDRAAGPAAQPLWTLGAAALRGHVQVKLGHTELRQLDLSLGASQIQFSGSLQHGSTGMQLQIDGHSLQLQDLGPIAGLALAGQGDLKASVAGPYAQLVVNAAARIESLEIGGHLAGQAEASVRLAEGLLSFTDLRLSGGGGSLRGAGQVQLNLPQRPLQISLQAVAVPLARLLVAAGLAEREAVRLDAALTGRLLLSGPASQPRGAMHLRAPELRVDGIALGPLRLSGSFGEANVPVSGQLSLQPEAGSSLNAQLAWRQDQTLAIEAQMQALPLALLAPFLGDRPLTGKLSGSASLSGPPRALGGNLSGQVEDLTVMGLGLGLSRLTARASQGQLQLEASLVGGAALVSAQLGLGGSWPLTLRAELRNLGLQQLQLLSPQLDADLVASGSLRLRGSLNQLGALAGEANLTSLQLRWQRLQLQAVAPVDLLLRGDALQLQGARLSGPQLSAELSGSIGRDGALRLTLAVESDAAALVRGSNFITSGSGPLQLRLQLAGSLAEPTWSGEGEVLDVTLRLKQMEQNIEHLRAHVLLRGRSLVLQSATADLGNGQLRLTGEAALGDALELNLRAQLQQIPLRPYPNLDTTLTGDLQLVGPWRDLLLKGNVHLDAMRYTARLDLTRMFARRTPPPLKVPAMDPSHALRLQVRLQGENNILIVGNLVDAELQANLTLTGTSVRPGLLGTVRALRGRASYRENVFDMVRAQADFVDENRIVMQYRVDAHTEACRMAIDLGMTGTTGGRSEEPEVQLRGRNLDRGGAGVDPQDVYSCLQFGIAGSTGNTPPQAAPTGGLGDTLTGLDALWAVTGLDEKVKRLLPPGVVDEVRLTTGLGTTPAFGQPNTVRLVVAKNLGKRVRLRYSRALDAVNNNSGDSVSLEYLLHERAATQFNYFSRQFSPTSDFGLDLRLHWEMK